MFRNIIYFAIILILSGSAVPAIEQQAEIYMNINFDARVAYVIKRFQEVLPKDTNLVYTKVPRGLVMSISETEFFKPYSTDITPGGKLLLQKIAKVINGFSNNCTIESHTEEILPDNSIYHEDWEITIVRANVITEYLIRCCGVAPERLTSVGFGDSMPFKENVSREGFHNNRVDFVIFDYTAKR